MLCEVLRVADDGGEGWCCVRCSGWLADDRKEEAGVPERDKRIPPNHPLQPTEAVFSVLVTLPLLDGLWFYHLPHAGLVATSVSPPPTTMMGMTF